MIKECLFGHTSNGETIKKYVLSNQSGMEVELSDFGASVLALRVPDKYGKIVDVVLGYDTLEQYYDNAYAFGAYIGRNANRIGGAKVVLDGRVYELEKNHRGVNNLHSGSKRSYYQIYQTVYGEYEDGSFVEFSRISPHLEQGFPGNLDQHIRYSLTDDNALVIKYTAVSDATTVINLTNHSYFNLSGHDSGTILDHELEVCADAFLLTDATLLPTGETASVERTPMDFRVMHKIEECIMADYEPLKVAGGYDHNYILPNDSKQKKAARLRSPKTGIEMEVWTDLCGLQIYTANSLDHKLGKNGVFYEKNAGICFETQFYPNACNEHSFPSSVFGKGEAFESQTTFVFKW